MQLVATDWKFSIPWKGEKRYKCGI